MTLIFWRVSQHGTGQQSSYPHGFATTRPTGLVSALLQVSAHLRKSWAFRGAPYWNWASERFRIGSFCPKPATKHSNWLSIFIYFYLFLTWCLTWCSLPPSGLVVPTAFLIHLPRHIWAECLSQDNPSALGSCTSPGNCRRAPSSHNLMRPASV